MSFDSDINTKLPAMPQIKDPILHREFLLLYDAIKILQVELSQAKARIKTLETS